MKTARVELGHGDDVIRDWKNAGKQLDGFGPRRDGKSLERTEGRDIV
jgi:hypothetical protein